jgi:hypothetical protein
MLLRNRSTAIEITSEPSRKVLEQVDDSAIALLRWLNANKVDYVLVGPVARLVRGDGAARGPVSIVPAPYGRNLDRLARALWSARARLRLNGELSGPGYDPTSGQSAPVKLNADKLVGRERWTLLCGSHDLDIEGRPAGVPRYQELLYDATRQELADGVTVEIASAEDIERYAHIGRTGMAPEIRVTRAVKPAVAVSVPEVSAARVAPAVVQK